MKALKAPLGLDNWCQRFCTQCNNITARQSLGWRSPLEHATSNMPDISAFCFEFYKPIWYFNSSKRLPDDKMEKTRYLCLADSSRDLHTYYIITEPKQGKPMILIQSVIHSRRKNSGTDSEYINNNPTFKEFYFTTNEGRRELEKSKLFDPPADSNNPGEPDTVIATSTSQSKDHNQGRHLHSIRKSMRHKIHH